MKENQSNLFSKKKIFSDSTGEQIPPIIRRALTQKNYIDNNAQKQTLQKQKSDDNQNRQHCSKQIDQQQKFIKSSTMRVFDNTQIKQSQDTIKQKENVPSQKRNQIFGPQSDRITPQIINPQILSKRLIGISQNHTNHQNYQNKGDVQCNYEEEDSMEEFNQLLRKKQPPTIKIAVEFTNRLAVFEAVVQFLQFEDLLSIKYVCKTYYSHKYQQKIKKSLFKILTKGINFSQQYQLWDSYINFNSVQKKYELQYYNYTLIPSPFDSEILQDLERTNLGSQETFDGKKTSQNLLIKLQKRKEKLKKVLRAICHNAKDVRYVQGLNQIVGSLVIHNLKENDIYWIVLYFLRKLKLNEIYKQDIFRLKVQTFQLEIFMQNHLPDLLMYFKQNKISVCQLCTKWFITIFSCDFENQTLLRKLFQLLQLLKIWNLFLVKGWKVLIRICLGLLKMFEKNIKKEPINNLSNYMKNFIKLNQKTISDRKLIETSFSMKVTNRLLLSLQNIFEQHQAFNDSTVDLHILLFQNRDMNNAYDWKILPQAPHFEGQNSTLERLNAHTMVADYINELSQLQAQSNEFKHKRSSSITATAQKISVQGMNNNTLIQRPHHQRSLSSTRSPIIPVNSYDIPLFNETKTPNGVFVYSNEQNNVGSSYYDVNYKSKTMNETEQEEIGLFKQISNKIISMFNNDDDLIQKQQSIVRQSEKEIQPIYQNYSKPQQYMRQSSTPQLFQKMPTQTKYYDQILEDYQEIKDQTKDQDESIQEEAFKKTQTLKQQKMFKTEQDVKIEQKIRIPISIKTEQSLNTEQVVKKSQPIKMPFSVTSEQIINPQQKQQIKIEQVPQQIQPLSSQTQQINTTYMTQMNQFQSNYYNPQQNNQKYVIVQNPYQKESFNIPQQQIQQQPVLYNIQNPIQQHLNQQPQVFHGLATIRSPQIQNQVHQVQQLNFNNTINLTSNYAYATLQQNISPLQKNTNILQYHQKQVIPQPCSFSRQVNINQQGWAIYNQKN